MTGWQEMANTILRNRRARAGIAAPLLHKIFTHWLTIIVAGASVNAGPVL
jgi:hypothetical protein